MIVIEKIFYLNSYYVFTYSDLNLKIKKVGTEEIYNNACDLEDSNFTYEETNIPIEPLEVPNEEN